MDILRGRPSKYKIILQEGGGHEKSRFVWWLDKQKDIFVKHEKSLNFFPSSKAVIENLYLEPNQIRN